MEMIRNFNLKTNLIIILISLVVPITLITVYYTYQQQERIEKKISEHVEELVRIYSVEEDQNLNNAHNLLKTLSIMRNVDRNSRENCSLIFGKILQEYPQYQQIGIMNGAGNIICGSGVEQIILSSQQIAKLKQEFNYDRFASGLVKIADENGKKHLLLGYKSTNSSGQSRIYFLVFNDKWFSDILAEFKAEMLKNSNIFIIGADGKIIDRISDGNSLLKLKDDQKLNYLLYGQKSSQIAFYVDGQGHQYVISKASVIGKRDPDKLQIVLSIPRAAAFGEVDKIWEQSLLLLGIMIMLIFLVVGGGGNKLILQSINKLVVATSDLGKGNLHARTGISYLDGAVGQIAKAFDNMAEELQKRAEEQNKAELALKDSEKKYRMIFKYLPIGIINFDEEGVVRECNTFFCKLNGGSRDNVIGKKITHLFRGVLPDNLINKTLIGEISNFEGRYITNITDEEIFIRAIVGGIFNEDTGYFTGIGIIEDISERKESESEIKRSEEQYRLLFEKNLSGVFISSIDGRIIKCNDSFSRILGCDSIHSLEGAKYVDFYVSDKERADFLINAETGSEMLDRTLQIKTKSGETRWIMENITQLPSKPGEDNLLQGTIFDITKSISAHRKSDLLANALKGIHECVLIVNNKGEIVFVNDALLKIYGYTRNELIGNSADMLRSREYPERLTGEIMVSTFLEGKWVGELNHVKKDGQIFPVSLSTSFVNGNEEKETIIIGVIEDITVRKKNEEELLKLTLAVIQSPVNIIITDRQGNIEYINPKLTETSGYTLAELKGKKPSIFKSGATSSGDYQKLWSTILNGEVWRGELLNKKKDGSYFWESVSISPLKNKSGEIIHFIAVKEDISEKKKMLEELIAAKEQAEESDRLKSEFLAQMSHEIRTPLNIILSYTNWMKDEFAGNVNEDNGRIFIAIQNAGRRLLRTINLILDMSMVQTGKVEVDFSMVSMDEIIEGIMAEFSSQAEDKGIILEYKKMTNDLMIKTDEYLSQQVLQNLVDNAVKYTKHGSVTISTDRDEHGRLVVEIEDTGIGIAEEFIPNLFNPFVQEEMGYKRSFEGNGLGLALVKKYTELLGARIEVNSKKGEGTIFKVIF